MDQAEHSIVLCEPRRQLRLVDHDPPAEIASDTDVEHAARPICENVEEEQDVHGGSPPPTARISRRAGAQIRTSTFSRTPCSAELLRSGAPQSRDRSTRRSLERSRVS